MDYLLSGNNLLEEIDVSNFNFDKVTNFSNIFSYNMSLKRIKMSYKICRKVRKKANG